MEELKILDFSPKGDKQLVWQSPLGYINEAFIYQIDFKILQKNKNQDVYFTDFARPGTNLFATILSYLNELGEIPSFDEIRTISRYTTNTSSLEKTKKAYIEKAMNLIPELKDGKIVQRSSLEHWVGGHFNPHVSFYAYKNEGNFGIVSTQENTTGLDIYLENEININNVKKEMIFTPEDTFMLLKAIFCFNPNNGVLKDIYDAAFKK